MFKLSISGPAGAGKDFIADELVKHHGFMRESFAWPMKDFTAQVLGITQEELEARKSGAKGPEEAAAVRQLLQRLGTECFRAYDEDVWAEYLVRRVVELPSDTHGVVITDCRFPNEFRVLEGAGFFMVDVCAPVKYHRIQPPTSWQVRKVRALGGEHPYFHPSERSLDQHRSLNLFDLVIANDRTKTAAELAEQVLGALTPQHRRPHLPPTPDGRRWLFK